MQGTVSFWALLFLLSFGVLTVEVGGSSNNTFFYLVRQWPWTFCGSGNCVYRPQREHFTIHGLWPNFDDGHYPQFCTPEAFHPDKLRVLRPTLDQEWPSFYGKSEVFWGHEWTKHGTCAETYLPTVLDFFNRTLQLHQSNPLEEALAQAEIYPTLSRTWPTADMVDAIKAHHGGAPHIHCLRGKLSEIWQCVGDDLKFVDCDVACPNPGCDRGNWCKEVLYTPSSDGTHRKERQRQHTSTTFERVAALANKFQRQWLNLFVNQ